MKNREIQYCLADIFTSKFRRAKRVEVFCNSNRSSDAEAVLIKGDIANLVHLCWCLKHLAGSIQIPICFVLGNHDYYGSSKQKVNFEVGGRS